MKAPYVLITGGAGFVGGNLANRLIETGERVVLFDDLSRGSVSRNVEWLRKAHGDRVGLIPGDIRDASVVSHACEGAAAVFHLAAQVAVTRSLDDPRHDFDVNAGGTLNVLEALRERPERPPLVFASTSKVYGPLSGDPLRRTERRYLPVDRRLAEYGVSEVRPLDFSSPYGCSKGAADQYVLDFARTYGITTVVFRMSCIYGPHQFGNEDHGWVAHFVYRMLRGEPITIYGNGLQVRDLLYVDDLVDAFMIARRRAGELGARVFNMGGGPENTMSLLELVDELEAIFERRPSLTFAEHRPGDPRYYASDTRRFAALTGWTPRVRVAEGLRRLVAWARETLTAPPGASTSAPKASPRTEDPQ